MNDQLLTKLPPQSIEAEESILSACMLGAAQDVVELITSDDFYRTGHKKIFSVIEVLVDKKINVDITTIVSALRDKSELEEVGGAAYIARLVDVIPGSISINDHANIIKAHSQKRQIISICSETIQKCYGEEGADIVMSKHDSEMSKVKLHAGEFHKIGDVLPAVMDKWEKMTVNPDMNGIPCGLVDIDRKLGGFQGSTLYIVGGRPGMGKTAWGMTVARGAACKNFPVLQISLEMSKEQLVTREVSCASGVDGARFLTGNLNQSHWQKITTSSASVAMLPIWVDDTPRVTIKECQFKIRQFYRKHGRCLVLIDYLDFITGDKADRHDLSVGTITKGLKAAAKEHDIPIILFCQLNRECEKGNNKRPEVIHLRNSGEIEQDADVIAFLYRDEVYNKDTKHAGVAEFIIRKFRQGCPGTAYLTWIAHRTTFANIASVQQ